MTALITTNTLNQKAIPSPAPHKTHFSSLFLLPRIKSLRKQGTEDDLINTQYDLHYELLLISVPRGWGGVGEAERFRWYSDGGMFVEMDRGGVLTYGKRLSMCVLSILKFACAFEQANQSLLFTF